MSDPLILARTKTSVEINGVAVPMNSIADALARFCVPLAFYNENSQYELSMPGSCFLARYRGQNFAITTKHQFGTGIGARKPTEACMLIDDGNGLKALTCSGYANPEVPGCDGISSEDAEDIVFLSFDRPTGRSDFARRFCDLTPMEPLVQVDRAKVDLHLAIGYPTEFRDVAIREGDTGEAVFGGYVSRYSKVYMETDRHISIPPAHVEFRSPKGRPITNLSNYDGLSGSPVFFVFHDDTRQEHLGYAGMISRAGNNIFHVFDGLLIKRMLDALIEA